MKPIILRYLYIGWVAIIMSSGFLSSVLAQGGRGIGLHTWPDVLNIVEFSGTVLVDDQPAHPRYFLDTNADGSADYHLSFGPWWYEPGDGLDRPEAGVTVTVSGVIQEPVEPSILETLLVFDLDGDVWRVPVEYGLFGWNAEPFWIVSDDTMRVSGTVFVDTTYFYTHYYLDTDGDTLPEFRLGFGPPWYEPASGALRPQEGDEVEVLGIERDRPGIDLLAVFELNGLAWRPLDLPAPWAGEWMRRNRADSVRAFCMNAPNSRVDFPPGNFGQGMGGANWPDSMFVQFWEIHPDSLPGMMRDRTFIGFHIQVHDRDRIRLMDGRFGGMNGLLRFQKQHHVRLRYYDEDLVARNLDEQRIVVMAWDEGTGAWVDVDGVVQDDEANTVTFESEDLAGYYAIASDQVGTAVEDAADLPTQIALGQNYPNPFNPKTTIPFSLTTSQRVRLDVYDVLGKRVAVLVDGVMSAGDHSVVFDAAYLPSGVYVYRLQGQTRTIRREFILAK